MASALGVAAFCAVSPGARAAEWSLTPSFAASADHDTNRQLSVEPIASEGLSMTTDLRLQQATERLQLSLQPHFHLQRFTDRRFNRSDDLAVAGGAKWLNERSTFGLNAGYRDESTLTSEIFSTGIIDLDTRRRDETADASWTLSQSERLAFSWSTAYSNVQYHGNATTPLSDNRYLSTSLSEQFTYSERLSFSILGSVGRLYSPALGLTTRFSTVSVGLAARLSERTQLALDVGLNRREDGDTRAQGFVGTLSVTRSTDRGRVDFALLRSVEPSGFGFFTLTDQLQISGRREVGPRLALTSSASIYRSSSAFHSFTLTNRTYKQVNAGLQWQAQETWSMGLVLGTNRASARFQGDASAWVLRLETAWTPRPRSVSR